MKFDDIQIGGAETGPVLFRLYGDEKLCQQQEGRGRVLLGELKRQMQLGEIFNANATKEYQDGVKIRVMSNRLGLADIDEIWIDVTTPPSSTTTNTVVGYIVQVFTDFATPADPVVNNYPFILFQAQTPSVKLGNTYDQFVANQRDWGMNMPDFDGYPDFGTKFIDNITMYDPADTNFDNSPYQTVYSLHFTTFPNIYDPYSDVYNGLADPRLFSSSYFPLQPAASSLSDILRRKDKKGFIANAGFSLKGTDVTLYDGNASGGYGNNTLFMVPDPDATVYSYSYHTNIEAYSSASFSTGPGFDYAFGITKAFHLPTICEPGLHTINFQETTTSLPTTDKRYMEITLILQDGNTKKVTFENIEVALIHYASQGSTYSWDKTLKINVGPYTDINQVVSFK